MTVPDPDLTGWALESSLVSSKQPHVCEVMWISAAGADEAKGFFGFLLFSSPPCPQHCTQVVFQLRF